jgi:hypothetical protein
MAMGREIYGFPKMLGYFTGITTGPKAPAEMKVETIVTERAGISSKAERKALLRVFRPTQPTVEHTGKVLPSLEVCSKDLMDSLQITPDQLDSNGFGEVLYADLLSLRMPFLFMRQFRDAVDPRRASLQSIQECRTEMTKVHGVRIYATDFKVEIWDHYSHPIRSDLGLGRGILDVQQAFWTCFDFEIGTCSETPT